MSKQVIINDSNNDIDQIRKIVKNGDTPICRRCKSPLEIAFTREESKKLGIHPGVYCPKNKNHMCIMIEIWDDEAKNMYDRIMNLGKDNPKKK